MLSLHLNLSGKSRSTSEWVHILTTRLLSLMTKIKYLGQGVGPFGVGIVLVSPTIKLVNSELSAWDT
jgi:hypothetical protein